MDHFGIDVHKRESQICILADGDEIVEQRIRTEPERFAAVLGSRPHARLLIEASTDSEWVARCLEALRRALLASTAPASPPALRRALSAGARRRRRRGGPEPCASPPTAGHRWRPPFESPRASTGSTARPCRTRIQGDRTSRDRSRRMGDEQ
jgi:hypothetical protein